MRKRRTAGDMLFDGGNTMDEGTKCACCVSTTFSMYPADHGTVATSWCVTEVVLP